ncbi:unnamed protein product [Dibothriocephalus latus]|uniref:Uncharacterized protein n=1 Tax=Dibothriocephalus latus TaxID=60516 RepID=A0A3P7KVV7_DIBLA|nr:unnamed protein product [Dibothriocephalus latus]
MNETEQKTSAAAGGEGRVGNAASSVDAAKSIPELRVQTPTVKGDSSSITEGERKPSRKASSDSQATDASCDTFTLRTPCSGCNPLSFFAGAYPPTVGAVTLELSTSTPVDAAVTTTTTPTAVEPDASTDN